MATAASAIGPTIRHPEPTGHMTDGAIPAPKLKSGFWGKVTNQSGASSWNPPVSFMPSPASASAFPNDGLAIRIELANVVAAECPHDSDPRDHRRPPSVATSVK